MTATAAQVTLMRRMIAEPTVTTYSDSDIRGYIERYPLMDGLGNVPYVESETTPGTLEINADWIATYDLNAAAADIWAEKAAALAGLELAEEDETVPEPEPKTDGFAWSASCLLTGIFIGTFFTLCLLAPDRRTLANHLG